MASLFWFALGLVAKYLIRGSFWDSALYRRWKARRSTALLARRIPSSQTTIHLGGLTIEHMSLLMFRGGLGSGDVQCAFRKERRAWPEEVAELEFSYLPRRLALLRESGRTADLNETYSLHSLRITRPQTMLGDRSNRPVLEFEPSNFARYLTGNDALDKPLLDGGRRTIRESYQLELEQFDWSQLPGLPVDPWFATVTAVITRDHQLVIALRSGMQAIRDKEHAKSWRASMSTAEGMLRPRDSTTPTPIETPSPFCTAIRALDHELGLQNGRHFMERDIGLIALGFDVKRLQPVGIFTITVAMDFIDVHSCWTQASDRHENAAVIPVPFEARAMARLLRGELQYEGKPVTLFSNHQEIGAFATAIASFGLSPLENELAR